MRRLLSSVSVVVAILGGSAGPAHATPAAPWLFVPVLSRPPSETADTVLRALEQAAGEGAIRNLSAAQQFERQQSREPDELTDDEFARAKTLAETANRELGSGHLRAGQTVLQEAEGALAGPHGDSYRQSRDRVQTLFDACSLAAMLLARASKRDKAAEQMAHCVRAYPSFSTEGEPEIQPLFEAASRSVPHGMLRAPAPEGCVVHANGIALGRAPLNIALPLGDYRLQIACGSEKPGRYRHLRVAEGTNQVHAEPLDAHVHTRGELWLEQSESVDEDAQSLGRALGAQIVLLIGEGQGVRVRADGRDVAVVAAGDDVRPILRLLEAPAVDTDAPSPSTEAPPAPITESAEPLAPAAVPSRSPLQVVAGVSLLAVGAASLTVGWVLYGERAPMRSQNYAGPVPFDTRDRYARLGAIMLGVSGFGAAALAASEPFLVSDDGIPTAAWVLAAGGLALVGVGVGFGLADHCEPQVAALRPRGWSCGFTKDAAFGPLLALHGLPLLALPAMYGLRGLLGGGSTVVLGFDGGGGHIGVRGAF